MKKQRFYDIDHLPMFEEMVDSYLEQSEEAYANFSKVMDKGCSILDTTTIKRAIKIYTEQRTYNDCTCR